MAFIENLEDSHLKERFSLLLLDPGEIYFEDYSVFYYPPGLSEQETIAKRQRGRLKVCSKSILFDPSDVQYPILKFPLKEVLMIEQWNSDSVLARLDIKDKMLMIASTVQIEMKAANSIAPYVFNKKEGRHLFSLNYKTVDECVPQMCQLHRASTLQIAEQNAMIGAIVLSRRSRVNFNTSWLEDLYEEILLECQADRITPLVTNPGRIMLTSKMLYFQPFNNVDPRPVLKIKLSNIRRITRRRFLLRQVGIEIDCVNTPGLVHLYLAFKTRTERDDLYQKMVQQPIVKLEDTGQENATLRWQNGAMSNYDYLMFLNSMADRSINDLTQYPVFPWVVKDYNSTTLDLSNPSTFRDLSKPIGALNNERLQRLLDRFHDMPEPKFLYGSHYSTPGYVLFYLARVAPEYMLCLQNGRFDHPDRMFNSISDAWKNCMQGASDFKELIPEFYQPESADFLRHNMHINFGNKQDGRTVGGVDLPPWASDPFVFTRKLREALESDYVSEHLHLWIDLVFGYKQRGKEAEKAHNLFYYLTYEGAVDLDNIQDPNERASYEIQIMEFGQTPKQLFTHPHPARCVTKTPTDSLPPRVSTPTPVNIVEGGGASIAGEDSDWLFVTKEEADISCDTIAGDVPQIAAAEVPEHLGEGDINPLQNFWTKLDKLDPYLDHRLHKEAITDVCFSQDSKNVFSVSQDTLLKMFSLEDQSQLRSVNMSNMPLSCCILMPDGKTILTGSWDNSIYVYSIEFGRVLETVTAHDDAVSSMVWRNNVLVSASWDSTVKVWQYSSPGIGQGSSYPEQIAECDHDSGVSCVDMNSDSSLIVSGTKDGQLCLWDGAVYQMINMIPAHTDVIHHVSFSPDGQRIVSAGADDFLKVVDSQTGTEVFSKQCDQQIRCLCWDGHMVLAGGQSGDLLIIDLMKMNVIKKSKVHQGAITCMSVSSDGRLATGGEDRKVILWKPSL